MYFQPVKVVLKVVEKNSPQRYIELGYTENLADWR